MNARLILHSYKTCWQQLRWWFVLGWLAMLAVAWPVMTFKAKVVIADNGWSSGVYPLPGGWSGIEFCMPYVVDVITILMAVMIGLHGQTWSGVRPVGKCDTLIAKAAILATCLALPLTGLCLLNLSVHGFEARTVCELGAKAALVIVPRLACLCLFAAVCRGFWKTCGGLMLIIAVSVIAAFILPLMPMRFEWPWHLTEFLAHGAWRVLSDSFARETDWLSVWLLWSGVLILAAALVFLPRKLRSPVRIGAVAVLWLGGIALTRFIVPQELAYPVTLNRAWLAGFQSKSRWPDLSAEVRAIPAGGEITAKLGMWPDSYAQKRFPNQAMLEIRPSWAATNVPDGYYTMWDWTGPAQLTVGGSVVAKANGPLSRHIPNVVWSSRNDAVLAVMPPGTSFPDHFYESFEEPLQLGVLDPGMLTDGREVQLQADMAGSVFRYEKIVDVPLENNTHLDLDGGKLDIRPLRQKTKIGRTFPGPLAEVIEEKPVWAGFSRFTSDADQLARLNAPLRLAFIYLPSTHQIFVWRASAQAAQTLLSGYSISQSVYGPSGTEPPPDVDIRGARFILLRPQILGTIRTTMRSGPMPLRINRRPGDLRAPRDSPLEMIQNGRNRAGELAPFRIGRYRRSTKEVDFERRPDPRTATGEDYWRWTMDSYTYRSSAFEKKDIAQFLPRQLSTILQTASDDDVWPAAVEAYCPESKKAEVIAAIGSIHRQRNSDWLSSVAQYRGWTEEARADLLRSDFTITTDPRGRLLTAAASLDDESLVPLILETVGNGVDLKLYEVVRQVPGIEPRLTATIMEAYKREKSGWRPDGAWRSDGVMRFGSEAVAIRMGVREAFDNWFIGISHASPPVRWGYISDYVVVPTGLEHSAEEAKGIFEGHVASDYEWDPLSRRWALAATLTR